MSAENTKVPVDLAASEKKLACLFKYRKEIDYNTLNAKKNAEINIHHDKYESAKTKILDEYLKVFKAKYAAQQQTPSAPKKNNQSAKQPNNCFTKRQCILQKRLQIPATCTYFASCITSSEEIVYKVDHIYFFFVI